MLRKTQFNSLVITIFLAFLFICLPVYSIAQAPSYSTDNKAIVTCMVKRNFESSPTGCSGNHMYAELGNYGCSSSSDYLTTSTCDISNAYDISSLLVRYQFVIRDPSSDNCMGYTGEVNYSLPSDRRCYTGIFRIRDGFDASVSVTFTPKQVNLYFFGTNNVEQQPNGNYKANERIYLKASQGYSLSIYSWQYRIKEEDNEGVWKSMPAKFNGQQSIDFIPYKEIPELLDGLTTSVDFRINYGCGTSMDNNSQYGKVTIDFTAAPPTVETISTSPSCTGVSTGSITLQNITKITDTVRYELFNGKDFDKASSCHTNNNQGGCANPVANGSILATNFTIPEISSGWYTLFLTNPGENKGNAYTKYNNIYVDVLPPLTLGTVSHTSPTCFGGANGSLTVPINNGTYPVNCTIQQQPSGITRIIQLTNATQKMFNFTNLPAATYNILLTDACGVNLPSSHTIADGTKVPEISLIGNDATCINPANGSIRASFTPTLNLSLQLSKQGGTSVTQNVSNNSSYTFLNLTAGVYTITPSIGTCIGTPKTFTITNPAVIDFTYATTHISCNGLVNGVINLTGTGSTIGYMYNLSLNGAPITMSENVASNLQKGTYVATVKRGGTCSDVKTANISINEPAVLAASVTVTNPKCDANNTPSNNVNLSKGSVSITISGGTAPYTKLYQRKNGANWQTYALNESAIELGTYRLIITDANNCRIEKEFTITPPATFAISSTPSAIICNGGTTALNLSTTATQAPLVYSYKLSANSSWSSPIQTNQQVGGGQYDIKVRDKHGCEASNDVQIANPSQLTLSCTLSNYNGASLSCSGKNDGTITVNAGGGHANYRYKLGTGAYQASNNFTGLPAGTYIVYVKDNLGCEKSTSVTLTQPSVLQLSVGSTGHVSCATASNGQIQLNASGGKGSYLYCKNNNGVWTSNSLFTGLTAGNYTFQVKDINGCIASVSGVVNNLNNLSLTGIATNPVCDEYENGSVSLTATGGQAGTYQYQKQNGIWVNNNQFNDLSAGSYVFKVKDGNGCQAQFSTTLSNTSTLSATTKSKQNVPCAGSTIGRLEVQATGGQSPYQYKIDENAGWQSSAIFSGLTNGSYTLQVKDNLGCIVSYTDNITLVGGATFSVLSKGTVPCSSATTAHVNLSAQPTTGNYQYKHNNGAWQTSANFTNLGAGTQNFTLKDMTGGCEYPLSTIIEVQNPLVVSISNTVHIFCSDSELGKISVSASGALGGYHYKVGSRAWQRTPHFTGLGIGNHTITVRDTLSGCEESIVGTILVQNPLVLSVVQQVNVPCSTATIGSVTIGASGAFGGYKYSSDNVVWQNSNVLRNIGFGEHTFYVKDTVSGCQSSINTAITIHNPLSLQVKNSHNVPCSSALTGWIDVEASGALQAYRYRINGKAWQNSPHFIGLGIGAHTLTVEDTISGCQHSISHTVLVNNELQLLVDSSTTTPCSSAQTAMVKVKASGAYGAYRYSCDGGEFQLSPKFEKLMAGSHTFTVRDTLSGCETLLNYNINISNELHLQVDSSTTTPCSSAQTAMVKVQASGAYGAYRYSCDGGEFQLSPKFEKLMAGSHTFTVRDSLSGCEISINHDVDISNELHLQVDSSTTTPCLSAQTAMVKVKASGAYNAYVYSCDGGEFQPSPKFENLMAGGHTFTVRDTLSGCEQSIQHEISIDNSLQLTVNTIVGVPCNLAETGSLSLTASGAYNVYQYQIDNGEWQNSAQFSGLTNKMYLVNVRDTLSGCQQSTIAEIPIENILGLTVVNKRNVPCSSAKTGIIEVAASGALGAYLYRVNNQEWQLSPRFNDLGMGKHYLSVQDTLSGCIFTINTDIVVDNPLQISIENSTTVPCVSAKTAYVELSAAGALGAYLYRIDDNEWQNNPILTLVGFGDHTVFVKDTLSGCMVNDEVYIPVANPLHIEILNKSTVPCETAKTAFIEVSVTGGLGEYSYQLNDGAWQSSPRFENVGYGLNTIKVKDTAVCEQSITTDISINNPVSITVSNQGTASCTNINMSFIEVSASGALGNYLYQYDNRAWQSSSHFDTVGYGNHTLKVKDVVSGCQDSTTTFIQLEGEMSYVIMHQKDVPCDDALTGSMTISVTGGTGGYVYQCNDGAWQNSPVFNNLAFGPQDIKIKDAIGCIATVNDSIYNIGGLKVYVTDQQGVPCLTSQTGKVSVMATGGDGGYKYRLNKGEWQLSNQFSGLSAGVNQIEVVDVAGCPASTVVTIANHNSLQLSVSHYEDIPCEVAHIGKLSIAAQNGGGAPYQYRINTNDWQTTPDFSGLKAGKYTISVKDAHGCVADSIVSLKSLNNLAVSLVNSQASPCLTAPLGVVAVMAKSGSGAPYQYRVDNGAWQLDSTLTRLVPGQHKVEVVDKLGCMVELTTSVANLDNLSLQIVKTTNTPCETAEIGTVLLNASSGGGAPYQYRVNNEAWTNDSLFTALRAGTHKVTVRDNAGCRREANVSIKALNDLSVAIAEQVNIPCGTARTGEVTLVANSSLGSDYQYRINNGQWQMSPKFTQLGTELLNFEVKDKYGCQSSVLSELDVDHSLQVKLSLVNKTSVPCAIASVGKIEMQATQGLGAPYEYRINSGTWKQNNIFNNLATGSYIIEARDNSGCAVSEIVKVENANNLKLLVNENKGTACAVATTGELKVNAENGGGAPYKYRINYGTWTDNSYFTGLGIGEHHIEVQDVLGCTALVKSTVKSLDNLTINVVNKNGVPCVEAQSGWIQVNANSGAGAPYTYRVKDKQWQNSTLFTNLSVGDYVLQVKDRMGCMTNVSSTIKADLPKLSVQLSPADVLCWGEKNGQIIAIADGGIKPYTYQWNGGQNKDTIRGLYPGLYSVLITDSVGCKTQAETKVGQPELALQAKATAESLCYGDLFGFIEMQTSGGTLPYTYIVNNNQYNQSKINDQKIGTHTIQVVDARGCKTQAQIELIANTFNPAINFLVASNENAYDTLIIKEISVPQADSLVWSFDPRAHVLHNGESPQIKFDKEGIYWVKMEAYYQGCEFSLTKNLDIKPFNPNKVEDLTMGKGIESFLVYPNPNKGTFTVDAKLYSKQNLHITIYSLSGQQIFSKLISDIEEYKELITLANMTAGVYVITATTPFDKRSFKIIVE